MGESISTIQRSPRISTLYKFAAPRYAAADGLADGSRRTLPANDIERSLSRAVVPKTKPLPVSATTFPTALSLYIAQGRLRKDMQPLSKLFSKAEPLPFEKAINNNLVYSSCLKHAKEMLLGDPRQADHRPVNAKLPLPHRHSSITRPCCSIERSSAKLLVFTCTRALDRLRTRRRVGSTRRRGNHMHDHSRFQRDIDWRHRRLSLSLSLSLSLYYYSQKLLTHNIGSASALPIIRAKISMT